MSASPIAITPDSSVVIAAFASWDDRHDAAVELLDDTRDLVAHVEVEAYSVLTRLPEPFRAEPALVAEHLRMDYPGSRMVMAAADRRALVSRLAKLSISGGAAYDAMVGACAADHGYRLASCDTRAAPVYDRLGIQVVYL